MRQPFVERVSKEVLDARDPREARRILKRARREAQDGAERQQIRWLEQMVQMWTTMPKR